MPGIAVTPRYGPSEADGDIAISSIGMLVRSSVDQMGVEQDDSVFSPRIDIDWGPVDITLTTFDALYEGSGTAEAQLDLGGVVISAGDRVDSKLDLFLFFSAVTWDFVPGDTFCAGLGLGYGIVDFKADIESLSTGDSIGSAETFGIPLLVARAGVSTGRLDVSLLLSGLAARADGDEVALLDADLFARYELVSHGVVAGALSLGYRYIMVDAEYDTLGSGVDADLDFQGPYFGLTLEL
ncbi:MAG: hypothetical protein O7B99_01560 [Planctomycetota bacterium]|nr:hypothetical protein [Planctomycetota bacterium]